MLSRNALVGKLLAQNVIHLRQLFGDGVQGVAISFGSLTRR